MGARQPLQFSLRALILLTIFVASALGVARDVLLLVGTQRPVENWSFAPMIGWLALAVLYWRPGYGDLLFVHGLFPAMAVCLLVLAALPSVCMVPPVEFWREFPPLTYWVLYRSCLLGGIISLAYWLWLWAISGWSSPLVPKAPSP